MSSKQIPGNVLHPVPANETQAWMIRLSCTGKLWTDDDFKYLHGRRQQKTSLRYGLFDHGRSSGEVKSWNLKEKIFDAID